MASSVELDRQPVPAIVGQANDLAGRKLMPRAIADFGYARYAELLGLKGIGVDAPDRVNR